MSLKLRQPLKTENNKKNTTLSTQNSSALYTVMNEMVKNQKMFQ